jgi:hypothetical protein
LYHRASNQPTSRTFWRYKASTNDWRTVPEGGTPNPCPTSGADVHTTAIWFPELNGFLFCTGNYNGIWYYNVGTNAWLQLQQNNGGSLPYWGDYQNMSSYSPVHHVAIMGGGIPGPGNSNKVFYRIDADKTVRRVTPAPEGYSVNGAILTVDPASGDFLFFSNNNTVYRLNPMTANGAYVGAWTQVPAPAGGHKIFTYGSTDYGYQSTWGTVAAPISNHGVVMFLSWNNGDPKTYLYKLTPFTPPIPPKAPTGIH